MDDTRIRFLKAIAAQLDLERIAEVHLFPSIRQGGMESGVAVLALEPVRELVAVADSPIVDDSIAEPSDETSSSAVEVELEVELEDDVEDESEVENENESPYADTRPAPRRFTVYTARYRHTLKGPDRGKWEVSVTEEADAPLLTIDAVVRGVQRRSGDVEEIARLTGSEMSEVVSKASPGTA